MSQQSKSSVGSPPASDAWATARIELRDGLEISQRIQNGQTVFVIEDSLRVKFFQIGAAERDVISRFDGRATIQDIAQSMCQTESEIPVAMGRVQSVGQWLVTNGLAMISGVDNAARIQGHAKSIKQMRFISRLNPICVRIPMGNPDRVLRKLNPLGEFAFGPIALVIWTAVVLFAGFRFWHCFSAIEENYMGIFAPGEWVWLLLAWVGLKIIHEMGHGLACQRFGGKVGQAGVSLILFTPLAYVDVTSSWRFSNRWHRIITAAGGMYFELFVAALALIAWSLLGNDAAIKSILYKLFLTAGITTLLFNANPLMKFDGYYILSDLLEIPNLYGKGQSWLTGQVQWWVFGWTPKKLDELPLSLVAIRIYGIFAFGWRLLISLSLIIGASVLFHGAGIVLSMIAVLLWFAVPLGVFVKKMCLGTCSRPISRFHLAGSGMALGLSLFLLFGVLSGPNCTSAPAIVRLEHEQNLRAPRDAFIEEICVCDGQTVREGDILVRLQNRMLSLELGALREQIFQSQIRSKVSLQENELAVYQAESKKLEQLQIQLNEKESQHCKLEVRAPFDGIVLARDLGSQQGRFVNAGDPLLTVVESLQPEVIVSVDQADMASVQNNPQQVYRGVFAGLPVMPVSLKRVSPRASMVPIHRALCADCSGPLAVRQLSENEVEGNEMNVEFLTPRLNVELHVPEEYRDRLKSGQSGRVVFQANRQSLGVFLFLACQDWLDRQIRTALGKV